MTSDIPLLPLAVRNELLTSTSTANDDSTLHSSRQRRGVQISVSESDDATIRVGENDPLVATPTVETNSPADRVYHYQDIFARIGNRLPPQISKRHIRAISLGGAIGTGVFVGIGTSLRHAGPLGTLIAYIITGSVVWSVVVSIGEMISFLPNVGGPVGIASLYVDPALGFALGWNAWYNWAIVLPTELSAASILLTGLLPAGANIKMWNWISTVIFLLFSILVNCLGSRAYGEFEFTMSLTKILTMIILVITCTVLNIRAAQHDPLSQSFFRLWGEPGPFVQYRGIPGVGGRFLGVWTTMMQACFSFFGSDIPAVAAGEVKNAHENIPKAVRKVWIRIALFYVTSALVVGLVVRSDDCRLGPTPLGSELPNGTHPLADSNGTTYGFNIDWSNNITCFLPKGAAVNETDNPGSNILATSPFIIALRDLEPTRTLATIATIAFIISAWSAATSDIFISSRYLFFLAECGQVPFARLFRKLYAFRGISIRAHQNDRGGLGLTARRKVTVIPWACLLVSFGFGLLSLMASSQDNAVQAFHWLSSMTSSAALLSWIGMSFTYLRWYRGTVLAARKDSEFKKNHHEHIYKNRQFGQPWIAVYALFMCILIVLFNGWYIFTRKDQPWRVAIEPNDPKPVLDPDIGQVIPTFVSSFLPIPFFLLCILGYKLVYRSKLVAYEKMPWTRGNVDRRRAEDESPHVPRYPRLKLFLEWVF